MMPASLVARRLPMLGLAALCAAALALSACGSSGGDPTAEKTAAAPAEQPAAAKSSGDPCQGQVDGFLKSMKTLRSNLAVGLSYEQYAAEMQRLRTAYDKVPVKQLTIGCLYATGAPAEQALNKYTDAANAWGECLAEAGCTTASIESALQRRWRIASHYLSEAQ
jgi:hypothetical protein